MLIAAIVSFCILLVYLYCGMAPQRLIFEIGQNSIRQIPGNIHLSFDDGPDPVATPAILDILKKYNRKAYFFLVGERVSEHPEIAQRILQEGHIIGNHSTNHPSLLFRRQNSIVQQIENCQQIITKATGFTPRLIRPPYGHRDYRFYRIIKKKNLECMLWSVDTFDYLNVSMQTLKNRFARAKSGDVILAHDRTFRHQDAQRILAEWLDANG